VVTGLFYGGQGHTLLVQAYGTFAVAGATLAVSLVLMYAVKLTGTLRVSQAGELQGLDIHEHGVAAYPEFVVNRGLSPYAGLPASLTSGHQPYVAPTMRPITKEGGTA
jgi:Amt family ammonium transporter